LFAGTDDDRFDFGLDLLVRGLAAYVPSVDNPEADEAAPTTRYGSGP